MRECLRIFWFVTRHLYFLGVGAQRSCVFFVESFWNLNCGLDIVTFPTTTGSDDDG